MSESESDFSESVHSESDFDDFDGSFEKKKSSQSSQSSQKKSKPLGDSTNVTEMINSQTKKTASDQYQRLSQLEHILKRPDTYIGSVERSPVEMWCFDATTEQMVYKEVSIVPGLYKIFDEILVNAADNKIRDPTMKNIKVKIDPENNLIEVMNDGKGIPVEIHEKEKIYIPELIFGNLLTSSNYDDDEKKVTGGRNGYGAKLCNIFSTEFQLETADASHEKNYKQLWSKNMSVVQKPKITKMKSSKEFTRITFKPDLGKFGMDSLDEETLSVLRRRVYDLCGTVKDCNVYLNDKRLSIRNFKSYVEMYVKAIKERNPEPEDEEKKYQTIVHEVFNDKWEIAFAVSDGTFNQVSFVNSIATTTGGTHVKFVSDAIISKLIEQVTKKEKGKKKLMIRPQEVRNNMFLFVNCLIENPAFTSQTKEQLTTKTSQFNSKAKDKLVINDQFITRILKTSIVDKIRSIANANEDKALQKADGSKKSRVKGQVKLVDANKAGTKEGHKCTLILTEGDSALSLAVAGLAVIGRDYYGCFPLRGKLLNVREASTEQVSKNAEINALKQIIGLQHKKKYTAENISSLRYGSIMIMTDQDQDGSHIKGLIINFLESSFPGLLEIPGFLLEFITPIVKVTISQRGGGKKIIPFYTMPEFEQWRETEGTRCRWKQKYYKGLGTSTDVEAREYFSALDKHLKRFHAIQGNDPEYIDLAFSKKKADERKDWLQNFQPGTHLDPNLQIIPIGDFINKELILFSMADNVRSIPSVLDGFKPGQRKVLFGCFKRNLKSEIKVAQLAGYVSEHTGYHHGEQSLVQTIIGLAQNFIGSNNLNLLKPNGAFGTRAAGGKDFSAARYIFTEINEITRKIFNPLDNALLNYVQEDEQTVEPEWYVPIIPMLLVNGTEGIGTGWSTNIPCYNPKDLVNNLKKMMNNEELDEMMPWYRGWEGNIEPLGKDKFKVSGRIEEIDDTTLEITEIPVKTWTNNIKEFLISGLGNEKTKPWIKDMEEQHGINIRFIVKLIKEEMEKSYKVGLLERFKLVSTINLTNMVAFDPRGKIKKYESPLEILKDFYYVRLEYYQKRKDFMTDDLTNQLTKLTEQARFIKLIIDKQISVSNKKRLELVEILSNHNFKRFNKEGKIVEDQVSIDEDTEMDIEEQEANADISELNATGVNNDDDENRPENVYQQYDYLLGMSLWSLTKERYEKLLKQRDDKQEELTRLLRKSAKDLWNEDLDEFLIAWEKFLELDFEARSSVIPSKGTKRKGKRVMNKPKLEKGDSKIKRVKLEKSDSKLKASQSYSQSQSQLPTQASQLPTQASQSQSQPSTQVQASQLSQSSSTPKKQSQLPEFFSPQTKPIKQEKRIISIFSDSEDDELLGLKPSAPPTKQPHPIPRAEPTIPKVEKSIPKTEKPKESSQKRSRTPGQSPSPPPKRKTKYKVIDSDSESEVVSESDAISESSFNESDDSYD
ncbi:DNA topoisomerase 2 [[Candida] jaroonii]|uniref:DNA topoisomerase 2 n=1 Tax=[Candida] jaroonii TaxID=467808 RepID=A0ACA9YG66_9ASCO|nr:DNA topoisomerase 2 [[Candida] jaroonii]